MGNTTPSTRCDSLAKKGVGDFTKLEHPDPASGFEHAVGFTQYRRDRETIADPKCNSVQIDRVVGNV